MSTVYIFGVSSGFHRSSGTLSLLPAWHHHYRELLRGVNLRLLIFTSEYLEAPLLLRRLWGHQNGMIQRLVGRLSVNHLLLEAVNVLALGLDFLARNRRLNLCLFALLSDMRVHGPAHISCVNELLI